MFVILFVDLWIAQLVCNISIIYLKTNKFSVIGHALYIEDVYTVLHNLRCIVCKITKCVYSLVVYFVVVSAVLVLKTECCQFCFAL